ncbi:H-NS histone family protein [Luteimonas sp. TWI875]|uniref:H-NS histone family protein n=1 Tax=unclassified Luteimonas TaxID=2629088 RepID=UPI003209C0E9
MEAAAKAAGYTIEELFGASGKSAPAAKASKKSTAGSKVSPKYRNPQNAEQTWSGRGLRPVWLRDAMSAGGAKLEDFAI